MAGCLTQGCPLKRDAHCSSLQADNLIEPSNLHILWMDIVPPPHHDVAVPIRNIDVHQGRHNDMGAGASLPNVLLAAEGGKQVEVAVPMLCPIDTTNSADWDSHLQYEN